MHVLASHYRSEFLAAPQLVRIDYALGSDGFKPTLLVKGSTLLLKYVVLGAHLQLHLARIEDRLLYAVTVIDDVSKPAMLWSIAEREAEIKAFEGMLTNQSYPIFLFNELALNVAWSTVRAVLPGGVQEWLRSAALGRLDYEAIKERVDDLLGKAFRGTAANDELVTVDLVVAEPWHPLFNHFITSHGADVPVDLFNKDEGGQQEQLAIWLTDSLHPLGVHHSPQIPKGSGQRELTDILLSHEEGAFLIESKALTVFNRETLPDRNKLSKDISQHVEKAIRQLRGGIRRLKEGVPVSSRSGSLIQVERTQPMHAIILIPEFALVEDPTRYGVKFIAEFMEATGGFLHLLDVAELLRVVQAAEMLSRGSSEKTPLMALDEYLTGRAARTLHAKRSASRCFCEQHSSRWLSNALCHVQPAFRFDFAESWAASEGQVPK